MEIRQALLSSNGALASTAQNVASGIEIAALQPGGISAIADSFQDIPPPQGAFDQPNQFADAAAFDLPNQYATRLNDLQRNASGLVSSADLTKNLIDPNLNVLKEAGSFYKHLLSMTESKPDISAASKRIDENYDATREEIESNKEAREDSNSGSLFGTIFGGPIIGTLKSGRP